MIWTRPLRGGIASYRFIKGHSEVPQHVGLARPERMPTGSELVAVIVLSGAAAHEIRSLCHP